MEIYRSFLVVCIAIFSRVSFVGLCWIIEIAIITWIDDEHCSIDAQTLTTHKHTLANKCIVMRQFSVFFFVIDIPRGMLVVRPVLLYQTGRVLRDYPIKEVWMAALVVRLVCALNEYNSIVAHSIYLLLFMKVRPSACTWIEKKTLPLFSE